MNLESYYGNFLKCEQKSTIRWDFLYSARSHQSRSRGERRCDRVHDRGFLAINAESLFFRANLPLKQFLLVSRAPIDGSGEWG